MLYELYVKIWGAQYFDLVKNSESPSILHHGTLSDLQ